MLFLEETTELILAEEGQLLMGMDFITNTLGLNMKRIESIFIKSLSEYTRRKPLTASFICSGENPILMPEGTVTVKATRYGYLEDYPRYFLEPFGLLRQEYNHETRVLKVFPPINPVKITYPYEPKAINSEEVTETISTVEGENVIEDILKSSFKSGALKIEKNDKSMVEVSREELDEVVDNVSIKSTIVNLQGTLGTGTINLTTRGYVLNLLDTTRGNLYIKYYSKYKYIKELSLSDNIFYQLFAANLLEAVSTLKIQITQSELHNIDLTGDDLAGRVRIMKAEVKRLLRSTINYSALTDI